MDWATLGTIAAKQVAPAAASWLMGRITGSPRRESYEQFIEEQSPVLEQLRSQALGQESPASRFLESRLQQAARQAKQAEAATSTRQGLGRQSAIARQRAINEQTQQNLAGLLGQLQFGSQQQYGNLMSRMGEMRAGMAEAEMGARQRTMQTIGAVMDDIISEYDKEREGGQVDSWLEDIINWYRGYTQPVDIAPQLQSPYRMG